MVSAKLGGTRKEKKKMKRRRKKTKTMLKMMTSWDK